MPLLHREGDVRKGFLRNTANAKLLGFLLGPTGNLLAPTLRKGRTLIVGFDAATYPKLPSPCLSPMRLLEKNKIA